MRRRKLLRKLLIVCLGAAASVGCCGWQDVPSSCIESHSGIAQYIAVREGYFIDKTLPRKFRNPGALVYRSQHEASKGWGAFATFPSAEAGWAALEADISYKCRHGVPLRKAWVYVKNSFCKEYYRP